MREYFASADGTQNLQGAIDQWHKTRRLGKQGIDPQFEYNRFTRAWHGSNPDDTKEQLLAAWTRYRSRTIDERGRI